MSHETFQRSAAPSELRSKPPISGELPKVYTSIALVLRLALTTKMYEFSVHLPSCCCFFHNSKFDFKDELRALWRAIDPSTIEDLTFHLGRLVDAIDNGPHRYRRLQLDIIDFILWRELRSSPEVVLRFRALLVDNDGPAQTLSQITLLCDALPVDSDATNAMAVDSASDGTMASDRSAGGDSIIGMAVESGIDGDATMESNSSAGGATCSSMTIDSGSDEDARMAGTSRSSESNTSPIEEAEDRNSPNSDMFDVSAWASDEGRSID
jgi:hypothetical protein